MANWSKQKVNPNNINGGQEYTKDGNVSIEELNAMVNSGLYSQDQADIAKSIATNQPDVSEAGIVGVPTVSILNSGTTGAKLKFANLKGEKGDKGEKGTDGTNGTNGTDGITPSITATATSISSWDTAYVRKTGTDAEPNFAFGIPKGWGIMLLNYDLSTTIGEQITVPASAFPSNFSLNEGAGQLFISNNGIIGLYDGENVVDDGGFVTSKINLNGSVGATFAYDASTKTLTITTP